MSTLYLYDENGFYCGICEGMSVHPNSTDVPPLEGMEKPKFVDGAWVSGAPSPVEFPTVSRVRFKMLWTSAERIATKKLRETDEIVDDFWDLLEDPQTTDVVLALPSVQQAVEYTLTAIKDGGLTDLDVEARTAQILAGILV